MMRSKKILIFLLFSFGFLSSWATPVSMNKSFRRNSLTRKIPSSSNIVQLTSSTSTKVYDYEHGEDDTDRLERIKKDLQDKMDGFRPWSVDMTSRRPGKYSITSRIIISNVAMYVLQMIYPSITRNFAKRSDLIMQGKELYRLFTPMFLHGSFSHLLLNSYSTQNIGPEVERLFGGGRFLATYIIGGELDPLTIIHFSSAVV
jgi:membrane associated rhomboid family serine protease